MKKITFIITFLFTSYGFAQNVSTGEILLITDYSVQFDVTSTEVTMTMKLPELAWLSVALDASSMGSINKDVVVYDSTGIQDRYLNGQVTPPSDGSLNQNWSQSSNTVTNNVRTVIATRALNTGDAKDYVFTTSSGVGLPLLWAKGDTGTFGYHGGNKGPASSTLGTEAIATVPEFKVYPNPTQKTLNVEFPASIQKARVAVYNVLGSLVLQTEMDQFNSKINTSAWNSGVYIMNISTSDFSQTKRIVKQ